MPISEAGGADIANKEFGGTDYSEPTSYWVGFRNNGTELTDGDSPGYERTEVEVNTTNFPATSGRTISNAVAFSTPDAEGDWLQADEVALYTASSGGTPRYTGLLDQPFVLLTGKHRTFGVGALRIRFL